MAYQADHRAVLLTGFGPFPGVAQNVSGPLAQAVAEAAALAFPEHVFAAAILPTEWQEGPVRLAQLLGRHRPRLVVHYGVAAGAQGFRLERFARNACRAAEDAAGLMPLAPHLTEGGPDLRTTGLPITRIAARLTALGFPVSVSEDAGGYLCNAVLYQTLANIKAAGGGVQAGFVHVPINLTTGSFTMADAVAGSLALLAVCLEDRGAGAG